MASTSVSQIRKKNVVKYNGEPCIVIEATVRTPPNLTSYFQMTIRNLISGKVSHVRTSVGDSFDVLMTEIRKLEYSYEDQGTYNFLDTETFENFELTKEMVEDSLDYIVLGQSYDILFIEGKAVRVDLPTTVEVKVIDAPDALRGDSSGNVLKPVTIETGKIVRVPLFIKKDEIIRVNTETGEYLGRA